MCLRCCTPLVYGEMTAQPCSCFGEVRGVRLLAATHNFITLLFTGSFHDTLTGLCGFLYWSVFYCVLPCGLETRFASRRLYEYKVLLVRWHFWITFFIGATTCGSPWVNLLNSIEINNFLKINVCSWLWTILWNNQISGFW